MTATDRIGTSAHQYLCLPRLRCTMPAHRAPHPPLPAMHTISVPFCAEYSHPLCCKSAPLHLTGGGLPRQGRRRTGRCGRSRANGRRSVGSREGRHTVPRGEEARFLLCQRPEARRYATYDDGGAATHEAHGLSVACMCLRGGGGKGVWSIGEPPPSATGYLTSPPLRPMVVRG